MTKETKAWVETTKAWIKQQQNSIDSCDIEIRYAKEKIACLKKQIRLELAERKLKVRQLNISKAAIKKA